ncbi:MAG: hypothetical protein K0R54_1813 [Clostridiaceae bacterium]|jgi:hypothetical protein|nr:hypothetical protein [Clostridiaceae bacterium]
MKNYEANLYDMNNRKVHYVTLADNNTIIKLCDNNVTDIKYHTPCGEGDRHFVDIYYSDGTAMRLFNIEHIAFCVQEVEKKKETDIPF